LQLTKNLIVNIWNSLPNSVIDACTVNAFKARLDNKFWLHQSVKFEIWQMGSADPLLEKMDEKLKSENMQKRAVF